MSTNSLVGNIEITINTALQRLKKLEGKNKLALENEFKEWLNAIENVDKNYDVLFINKINE